MTPAEKARAILNQEAQEELHYQALQELHAFCLLTPGEQEQVKKIEEGFKLNERPTAAQVQVLYKFMTRVLDAAKRADATVPTPAQCRHCKAESDDHG